MIRLVLSCALVAFAVACSEVPVSTSLDPEISDGAPLRHIEPEDVADAVPRADPILSVGNKTPYEVNGKTYDILDNARNYKERGIASWYGTKFHGRKTSNGELYDLYAATAAHKTLPIPSYARVTNLDNGRSVIVRVNDRGPFHDDRLIDLSYGAAVKLGYMEKGTAPVEVEVLNIAGVDDRRGTTYGEYRFLQLGAYGSEATAQALRDELTPSLPVPVFISPVESGGKMLYRVRVGPLEDQAQLDTVMASLRDAGHANAQPLP
ncbi:MAG: septal ring lytic transglycosylase RlpA family protein [Halioglobus sp.]